MRAVCAGVKAEARGDLVEIGELGFVEAIDFGDQPQRVEQILEQRRAGAEQGGGLVGIGFEPGHRLLGEIIEAAGVFGLVRLDMEQALEGGELGRRRVAIGARHLGGQRDGGDGEGHPPAFGIGSAGDGEIDRPARRRAGQRPQRPAEQQPGRGPGKGRPDAHAGECPGMRGS